MEPNFNKINKKTFCKILTRILCCGMLFGIGLIPFGITFFKIKTGENIGIKNEILFVVFAGIIPGTLTGIMLVTYFDKLLIGIYDCFGINDWY
jgi:hypothetical protein